MRNWRKTIGYLCLIFIAITMLYPFFAMLNLSLVPNNEIYNQAGKLIYSPISLKNFVNVFEKIPLWTYFANSLFVAIAGMARGSAILKNVVKILQPSIFADSSKSFGSPRKYCLIKNIPNPPNNPGIIRAW